MEIIWKPYGEYLNSNLHNFCRKVGVPPTEIREKSLDIEWFWSEVEKFLGIIWKKRYKKVLNVENGIAWATWFEDGELNLAENLLKNSDKISIIYEGEDGKTKYLSYSELSELTGRFVSSLKKVGVRKGDRVGLFAPMCPETVAAFIAIAKIGAIVVPAFSGYGPDALAVRLQDAEAKVLITADGFIRRGKFHNMKEVADEAVRNSPSIESVIVIKRFEEKIPISKIDKIFDYPAPDFHTEYVPAETPFMIIYTSGTTGKPKGAVHVHGGFLVKIAEEVAFQTDCKEDDILFWVTDIGWIMGPWEIVGVLQRGATLFLYDGAPDFPTPSRIFDLVGKHKITILGISPTLIRSLMKFKEEDVLKSKLSLRIIGSTGEPWNLEPYMWVFEKVGKRMVPIINLSGGTEVGACFLSPHPTDELKPMSLVGPALGMDIDIFSDDGKPLPPGEVGELVCKKPWPGMTRGLWKSPERYIQTYWERFPGVWYHGDFASRDKDGFWYLHGRSDDTIKVAGKRVGPVEVETVVVGSGKVLECAAIGIPDEVKGEAIVVFAVPKVEPSDELKREIMNLVSEKLGKPLMPKDVKFVKSLPKTRNAKIMRRVIRAAYLNLPLGDISSIENPESIEEIKKLL